MKKRTEAKLTNQERKLVEAVAKYFDWTITEVLRRSLRFGLNALLKFETNKKMDLKRLEASLDPKADQGQEDDNTEQNLKKMIEICNTPWLEEEER